MADEKPKTERLARAALSSLAGNLLPALFGALIAVLPAGTASYFLAREATNERITRLEERLTRSEDLRARADAREARLVSRLDSIGVKLDQLKELVATATGDRRVADERWRRLRDDVGDLKDRLDRARPGEGIPRSRRE